jgi:hypothetical protein
MNNCPDTQLPEATSEPSLKSVYNLFAILVLATLAAMFVTIYFVEDLRYDENNNQIQRNKITIIYISKFYLN